MDEEIEDLDFKGAMNLLKSTAKKCKSHSDKDLGILSSFTEDEIEEDKRERETFATLLDRLYFLSDRDNEYWEFCTLKVYISFFNERYIHYLSERDEGDVVGFCFQELRHMLNDRHAFKSRFDFNNLRLEFRDVNLLDLPPFLGKVNFFFNQKYKGEFLDKLIEEEENDEFDLEEHLNLKQKDILKPDFRQKNRIDDKECDVEIGKISQLSKTDIPNKIKFHGKQTEFIELIKAMIENGNLKGTQKDIIYTVSSFFDIKIKNPNKIITDIKGRNNGSETLFLNQLKTSLINYINKDNKK